MFFTSIFVYLSEAILALAMLSGLWFVLGRWIAPTIKRLFPGVNADTDFLRRFACWQVVFLAAWSVIFKILLPPFFHLTTGPLFTGPSQYYATDAEFIGSFLALIALVRALLMINSYFRTLWGRKEVTPNEEQTERISEGDLAAR